MLFRWFYTSTSRLSVADAEELVTDIFNTSVPRNHLLDVTGALLFTGRDFVQYLEGPQQAIDDLRHSILDDLRHENIRTLAEGPYPHRRFLNWWLAYPAPHSPLNAEAEIMLRNALEQGGDRIEALAQFMSEAAVMGQA